MTDDLRKLSRVHRIIISVIISILIGTALFFIVVYGFRVREIIFDAKDMAIEWNQRMISGNILFFPGDKIKKQLLSDYPQLSDVAIIKSFPSTIIIRPILRTPFAELVTSRGSFSLDATGIVIGPTHEPSQHPEIHLDIPTIHLGGKVTDRRVIAALSILIKTKNDVPFFLVTEEETGKLRAKSEKLDVYFSDTTDAIAAASTLQQLIAGFRIKGTLPKSIDLRFTKPVIVW